MGLEIGIGLLTLLMFGSLIFLLMLGLPLAFVTGGLGVVFLCGDINMINILPSRIFPFMTDYQLSAIPLFIFMANVLERAGMIEQLFDVVYKLLGGLKGGLATASIIASTILAAMVGVIGACEVTLGILIPPSILAILFAVVAQQSVGELFIGAVIPGLILSGMFIAYVTIRCYINPSLGPALPKEKRITFREKLQLLQGIIAPILLIILVLGVIFAGVATPVEAAGIGTFGALFVCALSRKLTLLNIKQAAITTLKASAMVLWIMFGASIFVGFYIVNGGQEFVTAAMMVSMTWEGFWGFPGLGAGDVRLWFGVVYMVNKQISFLSPPFGYALYYLKSVAPPEVSMGTIFKGVIPFMIFQAIGLFLIIAFPQLSLYLPRLVYG